MTPGIVLLSGGIDSFACAHFLKARDWSLRCAYVDYGHAAASQEAKAVARVAEALELPVEFFRISLNRRFGSGEVLGRNLLFVSLAFAASTGIETVVAGIHSGTQYFDCSPAFCSRVDDLLREHSGGRGRFFAPFINWSKGTIIEYCRSEGLDLSISYSCESGGEVPCGQCLSCLDRAALSVR